MLTKNPGAVPRSHRSITVGTVSLAALLSLAGCETTTTEETQVTMPTGEMTGSILDSRLSNLRKEVEQYPKKHALHYEIAQVHYQKNDLKESAKSLHRAIEISPTVVKYHYHLGRVYLRMSELSLAEEQFRIACDRMPRDRYTGPHAALGYTLARQRRIDEAIAEFETCLKIEPENPAFYYFLGSLYDLKGENENVIHYYREYLARGGKKYQKKAVFVLEKLGIEVETPPDALTSAEESTFGSEPFSEPPAPRE
jgi:tetratricopeptide (TPR) repeat protein